MTDDIVLLPLAQIEGLHLARLLEEFDGMLQASREGSDPALDRLTPRAYPDDDEASDEYAQATRDDLLDRRVADIDTLRTALIPFRDGTDAEDALDPRDVVIRREDLPAWLRTLTALRLVIASRLGIDSEDVHDPEDPRFGVYDWLGYRLDGLVSIADQDIAD